MKTITNRISHLAIIIGLGALFCGAQDKELFKIGQKVWTPVSYAKQREGYCKNEIGIVRNVRLVDTTNMKCIPCPHFYQYWIDCDGIWMDGWYDEAELTPYRKHESKH